MEQRTTGAQADYLSRSGTGCPHSTLRWAVRVLWSGISVTLEDFEGDIADYLWAESQRLGQSEVEAFLLEPGPIASATTGRPAALCSRLKSEEASDRVRPTGCWNA